MPSAAPDSSPPSESASGPRSAPGNGDSGPARSPAAGASKNGNAEREHAAALPDRFADGTMQRLEPAIRTIWMLKLGAGLLLLVGAVFFYELVQWLGGAGGWPFLWSGVLLAAGALTTVALPTLRYRYWRYALRPEELYLERGVFNRVRTVVPLRRIQHLDVSQDLFEREFGLGKLVVHTAGGRSSNVAVPGLRYETAERLRDDVKHYVLDHTV